MKKNETSVKEILSRSMARKDQFDKPAPFDSDAFRRGDEPNPGTVQTDPQESSEHETRDQGEDTNNQQEQVNNEDSPGTPSNKDVPTQQEIDAYWNGLKNRLSTENNEYQIPEPIKTGKKKDGTPLTDEERFGLLTNEIVRHAQYHSTPEVDQVVRNIITAASANEEFNLGSHLSELSKNFKDPNSMSLDDRLFESLKAEYGKKGDDDKFGLSDEDIKGEMSKMSAIDKREKLARYQERSQSMIQQQTNELIKQYNEQLENNYQQIVTNDNKLLDAFLTEVKAKNSIPGFDLSEAEFNEFLNEAPDFFKKKIVQGANGFNDVTSEVSEVLEDIMSDATQSIALLPFLWMIRKGKLMGYTSSVKERMKMLEEQRHGDKPDAYTSGGTPKNFDSKSFREGN